MQTDNRLLDDLARVASGAFGAVSGVRHEVEARLKQQFERILSEMDLVQREEFEAVKAMAAKARTEQEALAKRLAELEARLSGGTPSQPSPGKAARPKRGAKKGGSEKRTSPAADTGRG